MIQNPLCSPSNETLLIRKCCVALSFLFLILLCILSRLLIVIWNVDPIGLLGRMNLVEHWKSVLISRFRQYFLNCRQFVIKLSHPFIVRFLFSSAISFGHNLNRSLPELMNLFLNPPYLRHFDPAFILQFDHELSMWPSKTGAQSPQRGVGTIGIQFDAPKCRNHLHFLNVSISRWDSIEYADIGQCALSFGLLMGKHSTNHTVKHVRGRGHGKRTLSRIGVHSMTAK